MREGHSLWKIGRSEKCSKASPRSEELHSVAIDQKYLKRGKHKTPEKLISTNLAHSNEKGLAV